MSYLQVRNWERYQHYKDRQPVWIKLHVALLDDLDMRALSTTTRLLWPHILLLAARFGNRIENDEKWLGNALGVDAKTARKALDELRKGRWLLTNRASKLLAKRYQNASVTRAREREEKKTLKPPSIHTEASYAADHPKAASNGLFAGWTAEETPLQIGGGYQAELAQLKTLLRKAAPKTLPE